MDRKQRRIRLTIIACLVLIPLLSYLEARTIRMGTVQLPMSGNLLVFGLININVLLLLLMVFLVLRNLVHLVFERQRRLLGSRLRTKMVISFVSLSLIPTVLLFFVSLQFISTSMDYWFNINVEQALEKSLDTGKDAYQDGREHVLRTGKAIAAEVPAEVLSGSGTRTIEVLFNRSLSIHGLDGIELINPERKVLVFGASPRIGGESFPDIPASLIRRALAGEEGLTDIRAIATGDLVRSLTPVRVTGEAGGNWLLIATRLIPQERLQRLHFISQGLEGYRQLMLLKSPLKTSLLVMLLIVTLLIIFCAIWFGFYVSRGLTGPIGKLAEATKRVAEGELDFVLERDTADEMGTLVDSFNQMTRDLLASKHQLEQTNIALRESNLELEKRRRYTETILQNVAAGVISIDDQGVVTTVNSFAEELLKIDRPAMIGSNYREVLAPAHRAILETFLAELEKSGKSSIQRPLRITVGDDLLSLLVNFTRLEDESGRPIGVVIVFDNLTQLEKAQRMAAWREVARRIAHEVKNPLTPIQLSAQRLRKKYLDSLPAERDVFDLCTKTIINQVDTLKRLVSEFSSFARMPAVQPAPDRLSEMVAETLSLYREAHKHIAFAFQDDPSIPIFSFDRKQMSRSEERRVGKECRSRWSPYH